MKKSNVMLLVAGLTLLSVISGCKKKDEPDPREAFVGSFALEVACGGNDELDQTILKSSTNALEIQLKNFMETHNDVTAEVAGNTFTIKKTKIQVEEDGETFEAELTGKGTLTGKKLSIDFKLKGPGGTATCDAEGDKTN